MQSHENSSAFSNTVGYLRRAAAALCKTTCRPHSGRCWARWL